MALPTPGTLFVLSAPSGTGKTTLADALTTSVDKLELSRSYTSRPVRPGEQDGVDYTFVSRTHFESLRDAGEFLEWAEVFGQLYGTRAQDTQQRLADGVDLVLVIDVQGAHQIRESEDQAVGIFVLPPSPAILEDRLRKRSGEDLPEENLQQRLSTARREIERLGEYDYVVVNDDVKTCVEQLRCIILAERASLRVTRRHGEAIVEAFRQHNKDVGGSWD